MYCNRATACKPFWTSKTFFRHIQIGESDINATPRIARLRSNTRETVACKVLISKRFGKGAHHVPPPPLSNTQIGSFEWGVLESLFQIGATLLKPCGVPLVLDKEEEFVANAPGTKGEEDTDPTDACASESWLHCHGSDRNKAYVACANGSTVHCQ